MKFYVYLHLLDDKPLYVGKGQENRAYNFSSRSEAWKNIVLDRADEISVQFLFRTDNENLALAKEKEFIEQYNPAANLTKENAGRAPMCSSGRKQQTNFKLPPSILAALRAHSQETGTPIAQIVERLVREHL